MHNMCGNRVRIHHEHDTTTTDHVELLNFHEHRSFVLAIEAVVLLDYPRMYSRSAPYVVPREPAAATFWPRPTVDAHPHQHYADSLRHTAPGQRPLVNVLVHCTEQDGVPCREL